jgi:hypothetical protein
MTRGGFGSKVHLMTDGRGLPIGCVLTQGNRNECPVFDELLDAALHACGGSRRHAWRPTAGTALIGCGRGCRRWASSR